jgi:hypothetical protein
MAMTDEERLRSYLGEMIPVGGSASDTFFSEDQIDDLLERHGSPEAARREGWEWKSAILANLVTTVEASSTRKLSDAHRAAQNELERLGAPGTTIGGGTKIHRIVRDF